VNNPFDLPFNSAPSTVMHIDLNSCFATIEQQANPFLRNKPIAVAAYASSNGCILAPSVEAKTYGVKTGMRVKDGKALCPHLLVFPPDPPKYRAVHLKLRKIMNSYTNHFAPKSIDEFVLHMGGYPALQKQSMQEIGIEVKQRIKSEVGDWLTVSIGIAPNRFLAKTGAGIKKPDGLDEINIHNYESIFAQMKLTDLCGIARQNEARLNSIGIFNVLDFYNTPVWKLKVAFQSINSLYWYTRLRGWEIDDVTFARRSYGNSYSLPKPFSTPQELAPILAKLVEKMSFRLRRAGYTARGVHLAVRFRDGSFCHKGVTFERQLFASRDIYHEAFKLLKKYVKQKPVANLAVTCFGITKGKETQLELFEDVVRKKEMYKATDILNHRWGDFVVTSARLIGTKEYVPDRIAFGNVKEIEEFTNEAQDQTLTSLNH
jgi:DNA polymerase IV